MGEEHPDVASTYTNFASIFFRKGVSDKAIEYYDKGLTIFLKTLGENHPYVAGSYNNIGYTWFNLGKYDIALKYYKKCLAINIINLGGGHLTVARLYYKIGLCNFELKNYLLAIDYLNKCFVNLKKGGVSFKIAECYEALDEKAPALDYFIQSAEIRKDDPDCGIDDESTKTSIENAKRLAKELGNEVLLPEWM